MKNLFYVAILGSLFIFSSCSKEDNLSRDQESVSNRIVKASGEQTVSFSASDEELAAVINFMASNLQEEEHIHLVINEEEQIYALSIEGNNNLDPDPEFIACVEATQANAAACMASHVALAAGGCEFNMYQDDLGIYIVEGKCLA